MRLTIVVERRRSLRNASEYGQPDTIIGCLHG